MKIEELIKERNAVSESLEQVGKLATGDIERLANMFINNKYFSETNKKEINGKYGVFYYKDGHGEEWVRVVTYKHDFLLSLVDMPGEYTWEGCKKYAEDSGYTLPTKEEWGIVDAYRDEINKVIEDNGGDKLECCYWSVSQYISDNAWFYFASYGRLDDDRKYGTYHGRSLAYPSQLL